MAPLAGTSSPKGPARKYLVQYSHALGLRALTDHEPDDLFEITRLRYERGAIVITSNRDEREIARLFGDPLLASAAMDRLLHHAHVLDLEGESYRNPPPERRRQRARASQEAAQ